MATSNSPLKPSSIEKENKKRETYAILITRDWCRIWCKIREKISGNCFKAMIRWTMACLLQLYKRDSIPVRFGRRARQRAVCCHRTRSKHTTSRNPHNLIVFEVFHSLDVCAIRVAVVVVISCFMSYGLAFHFVYLRSTVAIATR